jgi:hypothetical protein
MVNVSYLGDYANVIIAAANLILIFFVFIQIRDTRKPVVSINVLSRGKEPTDRQLVLESGELYVIISNSSKNIARNMDINCKFKVGNEFITVNDDHKKLDYLNCGETARFILSVSKIIEKCPELFENIVEENTTITTPKKAIKMNLRIKVCYNPIFYDFGKYNVVDDYYVEWQPVTKVKDNDNFLPLNCWNLRNKNFYINKINGAAQEVKTPANWDNCKPDEEIF